MAGPTQCAGAAEYCQRRYDAMTFLTAHNAFATEGGKGGAPFAREHQELTIPEQLAYGVRGFMLDTAYDEAAQQVQLCCSNECAGGRIPIAATLQQFRDFLTRKGNRGEVLTLILEDYAPNDQLLAALDAAGLKSMLYVHKRGKSWPTLGEMVAANKRLVVFIENDRTPPDGCVGASKNGVGYEKVCGPDGNDRYPGLHVAYDFMWDTQWGVVPSQHDAQCASLRGNAASALLLMNHFITKTIVRLQLGVEATKMAANSLPERMKGCAKERNGRVPNFIAINWVGHTGATDIRPLIRELNHRPLP